MESLAVNDFQNDDWKITHISSLYSNIEFLKGEISVKNDIINKLINKVLNHRCNAC